MKKVLFIFTIIQLGFSTQLFANDKIFNLKNCYDTSSKVPILADKKFSWNVNLITKQITESYENSNFSKIWNILSHDGSIIEGKRNQKKNLTLLILTKENIVIILDKEGLNLKYQCS